MDHARLFRALHQRYDEGLLQAQVSYRTKFVGSNIWIDVGGAHSLKPQLCVKILQDSGLARNVVGEFQMLLIKGNRPAIEVNVPTRWATDFFGSEKHIKINAGSQTGNLSSSSKRDQVRDICLDSMFWENTERLVELLTPFSDAIHQLEGDVPHLADCRVTLTKLRKHSVAWAAKHDTGKACCEAITEMEAILVRQGLDLQNNDIFTFQEVAARGKHRFDLKLSVLDARFAVLMSQLDVAPWVSVIKLLLGEDVSRIASVIYSRPGADAQVRRESVACMASLPPVC
jgi:hypothetical protein